MNQKAQRAEIEFPLLLNLQSDRPRVASDFRSVERLNAPYINGMIQPFWKKEYEFTNKPVYDYKNNRYEIIDGYLTKNGEELFGVNDNHFERTDVTDEFKDYLAFDFSADGQLAKLEWDTITNSIKLTFGNGILLHSNLFTNGVILTSRVRVINNVAVAAVIYKEDNNLKMLYLNTATNKNEVVNVTWCTCIPKSDPASSFAVNTISIANPSPVINIANPLTNVYAVSLVSNYGEVLYTRKEGYFTLVDNGGTLTYGPGWVAANGSSTETIRNYNITNFLFGRSYKYTAGEAIYCYYRNNVWYSAEEGHYDEPIQGQDQSGFSPSLVPDRVVVYSDITYNVYKCQVYTCQYFLDTTVDKLYGLNATVKVVFSADPDHEYTGTITQDNSTMRLTASVTAFSIELSTDLT